MRVCVFLLLLAAFMSLPAIAADQVFTWVDAHGTIHYADTPPADGAPYKIMNLAASSVSATKNAPAKAASDTSPAADDADNAADTNTDTDGKAADAGKTRSDVCAKLTSNIKLLKSKQIVVSKDAKGASTVLDAKARQQQLATSEQQYKQYCRG